MISGERARALGGWQAELILVPDIAGTLGLSLDFLDTIAASLVVDAGRMRSNLEKFGEPGMSGAAGKCRPAADELLGALAPYLS